MLPKLSRLQYNMQQSENGYSPVIQLVQSIYFDTYLKSISWDENQSHRKKTGVRFPKTIYWLPLDEKVKRNFLEQLIGCSGIL